jgi:hypothetical protein
MNTECRVVKQQWTDENGKLHRLDGPALITKYYGGDYDGDCKEQWYIHGQLHRDNGPAVINSGGFKEWYIHGKRHRLDGPAISSIYGDEKYGSWYVNDKLHRLDGPAQISDCGTRKSWYLNGVPHRADGPAMELPNGSKYWFFNGMYHRLDGPAIEYYSGRKEWWVNSKRMTEKEFNEFVRPRLPEEGKIIEIDGNKYKLVKA